MKRDRL